MIRHRTCGMMAAAALLALSCAPRPEGKYKRLSEKTLALLQSYTQRNPPWHKATPDEIRLRRRIFELQEEALRRGGDARSLMQGSWLGNEGAYWEAQRRAAERAAAALQLTCQAPPTFIPGRAPEVQVTLTNRSGVALPVRFWDGALEAEVIHASGNTPIQIAPSWRVRAASHRSIRPPPPAHSLLRPGASLSRPLPLRRRWTGVLPGIYHLRASLYVESKTLRALGLREPHSIAIHSGVVRLKCVLGTEADGLAAAVTTVAKHIDPGRALSLKATLRNTLPDGTLVVRHPSHNGRAAVKLRDPASGAVRWLGAAAHPSPKIEPDGWSPHYDRREQYVMLSAGKTLDVTLTIAPEELTRHLDLLRPGNTVELVFDYNNRVFWFIRRGKACSAGAWLGHIASAPVRLTVADNSSTER